MVLLCGAGSRNTGIEKVLEMTKERLKSCYMLRKELALTERLIKEAGNDPLKSQRLLDKAASLKAEIEAIQNYIDSIESSRMRQILTLKYFEGLTARAVGAYMGYCPKSITRFLKKHFDFNSEGG